MKTIDCFLIGLGNVNRSFLHILELKRERLARQYGLAFRVVAVADSSGVAVNPAGFDPAATRQAKEAGTPVREGFSAIFLPVESKTEIWYNGICGPLVDRQAPLAYPIPARAGRWR